MGRKKGQQQRTKGGVLPSSSVRSADLLTKEGANAGLGLCQSLPSVALGNIPELSGLDSISNIEFRSVLKKLYKRDVTTKLKALAELAELCGSSEQHEVLSILPFWPRIYSKLFEDKERRVRESGQKAMQAIVIASGKNLATQLKSIMGCWFVSQCDSYAPAALTAETSISHAFAGDKRINAYVFCRVEILLCIREYLFWQHGKYKLSDEVEDNFHRITASCLDALSLFIRTVTNHKPDDEELQQFFENNRFWKFQKHNNSSIRSGFYSVLESICIVSPDIANRHASEICKSIFHRLDECNVNVCKSLYAAAVAVSAKCVSWYENIDIQKGLIAGFRNILKAGCYGLGGYVLPTLLPIFAMLPFEDDTSVTFLKVLECLRLCIKHDLVNQSKRGSELAVQTFVEILQLLVNRISVNISDPEHYIIFCDRVVKEELLDTVCYSWSKECSKFLKNSILKIVPPSIQAWESHVLKYEGTTVYSTVLRIFWESFSGVVQSEITSRNKDSIYGCIIFLSHLIKPVKSHGEKRSVKFGGSDENCQSSPSNDVSDLQFDHITCIRKHANNILISSGMLHPFKCEEDMLSLQVLALEKLSSDSLFCDLYTYHHPNNSASNGEILYINDMLMPEICRLCEGDKVHVASLSSILASAIKRCQSNLSAVDISYFGSTQSSQVQKVFLLFLDRFLSSIDSATFWWLKDLFCDKDSVPCKLLESVVLSCSTCECTNDKNYLLSSIESWELLKKLFTASIDSDKVELYLCDQSLCCDTAKSLERMLEKLNGCMKCYQTAMPNYAELMVAILNTRKEVPTMCLRDLWLNAVSNLFTLHFGLENPASTLNRFEKLISVSMINTSLSRTADGIPIFLKPLSEWVKIRILDWKFNQNLQGTVECAKMLMAAFVNILGDDNLESILDSLLPSHAEWRRLRNLDEISIKVDSVHHKLLTVNNLKFSLDVSLAFHQVLNELMPLISKLETDFNWNSCQTYISLLEESVLLASACDDGKQLIQLIKSSPSYENKFLQSRILEKSFNSGGIWALSLKMLDFCDEDFDLAVSNFRSSLKSEGISLQKFQFLTVASEMISDEKIKNISDTICDHVKHISPSEASTSDVYAFALGLFIDSMHHKSDNVQLFWDCVFKWKEENSSIFILDDDFDCLKEREVVFNSCIGKFFCQLIGTSSEVSEPGWDFIQCALLSWMENASRLLHNCADDPSSILSLLKASCSLLKVVDDFMSAPTTIEDPTLPSNLVSEWNGFFSNAVKTALVKIYIHLCGEDMPWHILSDICEGVMSVNVEGIFACVPDLKPKLSPDSLLPDDIQTVTNHLCSSMLRAVTDTNVKFHSLVVYTSYHLLVKIIEKLASKEADSYPDELQNVLLAVTPSVNALFEIEDKQVAKMASVVDSDAEDFCHDDHYDDDLDDFTDNANVFKEMVASNAPAVLVYLLTWKILIKLTKFILPDKKNGYILNLVKQNSPNMSDDLLPKLFRLMVGIKFHFQEDPAPPILDGGLDINYIEHVAGSVYKDFLVEMPAAARSWFNDLSKTVRSRVDKFTSVNVSPVLIKNEFTAIKATAAQQNKDGMEISARPSAREVHASYQLNELVMEIAVCLPPNHPLGPIVVNTEKRAGVVVGQWRYWLLQITTFLQYQNGGIIDGLLMWKERVDKKFDGMEECMICFSVVHGSNQSLPKLKCKTCKKKYHAHCLYKWFDTSNNSTCPLCRSPMIFR